MPRWYDDQTREREARALADTLTSLDCECAQPGVLDAPLGTATRDRFKKHRIYHLVNSPV